VNEESSFLRPFQGLLSLFQHLVFPASPTDASLPPPTHQLAGMVQQVGVVTLPGERLPDLAPALLRLLPMRLHAAGAAVAQWRRQQQASAGSCDVSAGTVRVSC
jgi:hypothetical protein